MVPFLLWLRIDLRRRWRSLVVLALLIALSAGTVLAAFAGARRGASALDRMLEQTLPAQYTVVPNDDTVDWQRIRGLPEVEALGLTMTGAFTTEGTPADADTAWGPPLDTELMTTIERPVVLAGRLADPQRADEAVVSAGFLRNSGREVGDLVTLRLTDGPAVRVRIVGVIRSFLFGETPGAYGGLVPSPALAAEYDSGRPSGQVLAFVRLRGGEADLAAFKAGLASVTGRTDIDVWPYVEGHQLSRRTVDFDVSFLVAFGLAALAAALIVVGQAVARHVAPTVAEFRTLAALGMTVRQRIACASAGPALAALVGATLGVGAAVVASSWLPIGSPALFEPSPGIDVDAAVLGPGWILIVAAVVAAAALVAWWDSAVTAGGPRRGSAIARAAANAGLPVPVVIGARFAFEPGRGRGAVQVRPALVASVLGVLGVVTALTLVDGVAEAAANPSRGGQIYQLQAMLGFQGEDSVPADAVLRDWSRDRDVLGATDVRVATAVAAPSQRTVNVYTREPVAGDVEVVLTAGRMPARPDEIVLGPYTSRVLGVPVGSTIRLSGSNGDQGFTVTGLGFVPEGGENFSFDGAWLSAGGFDSLFSGFKYHLGYVSVRPGASIEAVKQRLTTEALEVGTLRPVTYPQEIQQAQILPIALAAFLALLAIGAVGHALVTAVRRRRSELAVLRALGMSGGQCRTAVAVQAFVLATVGLVFGLPLGLALGRVLWRIIAGYVTIQYVPPVPLWALVLSVPVTLLVAYLLAVLPGERAARMRVGQILRAE